MKINFQLRSQTLGAYNSTRDSSEYGILTKIPGNINYNELIYDQTVLGMDCLDCRNQTHSLIDFKIKDRNGNLAKLHDIHVGFFIMLSRSLTNDNAFILKIKNFSF